jgi:phosphomannomutase
MVIRYLPGGLPPALHLPPYPLLLRVLCQVYGSNGAQIIAPVDKAISAAILSNAAPWNDASSFYAMLDCSVLEAALRASPLVSDPTDAAEAEYFSAISRQLCHHRELNATAAGCPVKVVYTAMHGVGTPFAERSFAAFGLPPFLKTSEQCSPDPEFPTVAFPNPEEGKGALALAMAAADRAGATLIIANDPDADRMAVAEKGAEGQWRVFTGNETGILLAHWLWTKHQEGAAQKGGTGAGSAPPRMIASTVRPTTRSSLLPRACGATFAASRALHTAPSLLTGFIQDACLDGGN